MRNWTRRFITASLAAALAVGMVAAPAMSQEAEEQTPGEQLEEAWEEARQAVLDGIKEHAQAAVDHRYASLDEMRRWLDENEHVTAAHESQLRGELDATERGLRALNEKIQNATSVEDALQLTERIASDFRVYLVLVPKVAGVVIGDSLVAIANEIERAGGDVQKAVDALAVWGYDVGEIQASLDRAMAAADDARSEAQFAIDAVIGLTAADWPSPAQGSISGARADLEDSGEAIRRSVEEAKRTLRLIHEALRG